MAFPQERLAEIREVWGIANKVVANQSLKAQRSHRIKGLVLINANHTFLSCCHSCSKNIVCTCVYDCVWRWVDVREVLCSYLMLFEKMAANFQLLGLMTRNRSRRKSTSNSVACDTWRRPLIRKNKKIGVGVFVFVYEKHGIFCNWFISQLYAWDILR